MFVACDESSSTAVDVIDNRYQRLIRYCAYPDDKSSSQGITMDDSSKYDIPLHVIEQADRCCRGKACLTDPSYSLGDVEYSHADPRFSVIACQSHDRQCNYKTYSNGSYLCTCPIRKFIFKRYEK